LKKLSKGRSRDAQCHILEPWAQRGGKVLDGGDENNSISSEAVAQRGEPWGGTHSVMWRKIPGLTPKAFFSLSSRRVGSISQSSRRTQRGKGHVNLSALENTHKKRTLESPWGDGQKPSQIGLKKRQTQGNGARTQTLLKTLTGWHG